MVYKRIGDVSADEVATAVAWAFPAIDQEIRQAICHCWLVMPPDRKTVHDVETEIRRLVERALKDLYEDARAFGISDSEQRE